MQATLLSEMDPHDSAGTTVQVALLTRSAKMRNRRQISKRLRRRSKRKFLRELSTVHKHQLDVDRMSTLQRVDSDSLRSIDTSDQGDHTLARRYSNRLHSRVFTTVRKSYRGRDLMYIGFGLTLAMESIGGVDVGVGLKACVDISRGTPITQYEGEILSASQANAIRVGNKALASHFATPVKGGPSINGFQLAPSTTSSESTCSKSPSEKREVADETIWTVLRQGKSGDPIFLDFKALKGKGGGSFANHQFSWEGEGPNAALVPDEFANGPMRTRDESALFLVAQKDISSGEFIHVNYGEKFVRSSKSNII